MKESGLTLFRLAGVIPGMRILRVTCCMFLLNWGLGHEANAEDYMARGRDLENRTLYGPAMAEYQRAIKETPEHAAEAHYRIGILSNKLGNTEGGMQEFRAALQADPNHTEARKALAAYYVNRGANARQQHRLPDAIQDLQEAVKFDPGSSTAHIELGISYEESGRLSEAIQEYQAVVTADPKDLTAQIRLGQGSNAQKQYEQATTAFKAVLEGNPNSAEAYAGLGVAYAHQGQAEEAKKAFDMAIRKHLVAGRRDLAMRVKQDSDALLKSSQ
jgi:tetratricopeptide (TPR) repeat protein